MKTPNLKTESTVVSRRSAIAQPLQAAAVGAVAGNWLLTSTAAGSQPEEQKATDSPDRRAVMAAGMTADEAECWSLAAAAAGAFFRLPELHPQDRAEVANAIHILQNKLLSRPTYRAYLEAHKKQRAEREDEVSPPE